MLIIAPIDQLHEFVAVRERRIQNMLLDERVESSSSLIFWKTIASRWISVNQDQFKQAAEFSMKVSFKI